MKKKDPATPRPFWSSSSLRMFALILFGLTLLSMVIAIGSIVVHAQQMRLHLPEEAWKVATDPALELTLVAPLVLIPPLLFAVAALWFASRQIVQPLQKLEAQAAALAWGDFDAIEEAVGGISEIQHLQKELAEMSHRVQAAQEGLRDYIGAITSAQEEERLRLAHELHDDAIQSVIALKQRVQLAQKPVKDQMSLQTLLDLEALAEQTIDNLRRMTRALRPIYLEDLGLATALEMLARETSQSYPLEVDFQKSGDEQRLPAEVELALYRIAQEALTNVVRHASARHADLQVSFREGEVTLEVGDDGMGFEVPKIPTDFAPDGHFGLLGIRERSELIGARLEVESVRGRGTLVRVRMELNTALGTAKNRSPQP